MFKNKKSYSLLIVALLFIILSSSPVFAGDGDGDGSGSGKNKNVLLTLESSSVKDGSTNVAINETIQLNFNKNICNITVLPNNKNCFHLTGADGKAVPIKLIFPDNQVQKEYKNEVFITPVNDLDKSSTYRISVDNSLRAKNGTEIDDAHTVTFTTGTETTDKTNNILDKLGDYIITYETSLSETGDSVPVNKESIEQGDGADDLGLESFTHVLLVAIILIIVIFSFVIFKRRKR